ncbi:MAG: glycosyltransferase [Microthrixaceae bacterium]|nr:glycosyltransferase [Microthrixaceae bacterium]
MVATHRDQHRRLTDDELVRLAEHPSGGTNRRRADRFGPLSPAVRRAVGNPVVGRARRSLTRQRRRLTMSPALRGLDLGIPDYGSIWLDLEPAWNDPADRASLLTRLSAQGVHSAVMIADVMPELYPDWFDHQQRRMFGDWLEAHLEHSRLFLCISHNTERATSGRSLAPEGSTTSSTASWCHSERSCPTPSPEEVELPAAIERYLLVVGTLEPRKNQALVLDAFDRLSKRHGTLGLVLVGRQGWMVEDLAERIRSHPLSGTRLLWPDAVTDGQLAWLYQHAFLTIAPSLYEGLGVPVMEALGYGSPTLASTGGALAEAGGGHVEVMDPDDVDALVVAIERHLLDPTHHQHLAAAAARYEPPRWSGAAQVVTEALMQLAVQQPPRADRPSEHRG